MAPPEKPQGFVNLGVAENSLMHDELEEFIHRRFRLHPHALTYGDGPAGTTKLRQTLAAFVNRYFTPHTDVEWNHIVVTNGVSTTIEACAWNLCNPGDGMLLARPVKTVPVTFDEVDPFSVDAAKRYELALLASEEAGVKVKALMLCSPHNPLGRCFPKDALIALMRFCQKYNLHLISDEIYALSVWENKEAPDAPSFTSVLALNLDGIIDPALVHVLWGLSKDFGANGLRIGCLISQSNTQFLAAVFNNSIFSFPALSSDSIAVKILSDYSFVDEYVAINKRRMAESYEYATAILRENGIPYYNNINAAFFLWMDLKTAFLQIHSSTAASTDATNGVTLKTKTPQQISSEIFSRLKAHKVFAATGEVFGGETPGWFRMVFTHRKEVLDEGLARILRALRDTTDHDG